VTRRHTPHIRKLYNGAYNPWETRVDIRIRCSVCGFAGIDPETFQEPEQAVLTAETTGTYTRMAAGTPVEEIGKEPVFFGDTTPTTGAVAHTSTNRGVFFGDTTPAVGAPAHTVDNFPVYFAPPGTFSNAPMYALGTTQTTFTRVGQRAGCPFCGSPNWGVGSAPDLLW